MSNTTFTTLFPLLSLVSMLWVLWSDSIRRGRTLTAFYLLRAILFLALGAVLLFNMFQYSGAYSTGSRSVVVLAALTGLAGALYFLRKAWSGRGRKRA